MYPAVFFLVTGIAFRLWLWVHPIEQLLAWTIADDGFYYFVIAQNIVSGAGSTFDGIQLTNGYHPLWMIFNILAFTITKNSFNAIHLLLFIEALSGILAGLALAYLSIQLTNQFSLGLIVLALWMFNHRLIAFMQNGLETGISTLLLILSALGALSLMNNQNKNRQLVFGILCGVTILARTDNVIFIGLLFLAVLACNRKPKYLLIPGSIAILILIPWFAWNYYHFHTILQTSTTAITNALQIRLEAQSGIPLTTSAAIAYLVPRWGQTLIRTYFLTALPVGPLAWLSALWLIGAIIISVKSFWRISAKYNWLKKQPHPNLMIWIVFAIWPLLFITIHVGWRWHFRSYYYASLSPSITLYFGTLLWLLVKNKGWGYLWASLLLPLLLLSAYQFGQSPLIRHQSTMLHAASWLNKNAQECPITGAFNAGIVGFYTNGTVINLDGVVNNNAAEAIKNRTLGQYAQKIGITCLADKEDYPYELLEKPEWGPYRPTDQSPLLWQEQHPYSAATYRKIYKIIWPLSN